MVEYYNLKRLCSFLPSTKGKMKCFWCDREGIKKVDLKVVDRHILLCQDHYEKYGDIGNILKQNNVEQS